MTKALPSRRLRRSLLAAASPLAIAASLTLAGPLSAAPKGAKVTRGSAEISTSGGVTTVAQGGRKVVIDWRSFDIDPDEAVRFLQPDGRSIALNRVLDGLPTHIRGKLSANGNVWIVNRHGIVFHAGSSVNVGGLLASTADIDDDDFMAGRYRFAIPGAPGARVVNRGDISFGEAGLVGLVGPGAENAGVIEGRLGTVVVGGAETFAVDLAGDGLIAFELHETEGAVASNAGRIVNEGGRVLVSAAAAGAMLDASVSMEGAISVDATEGRGGSVEIAAARGDARVGGEISARGAAPGVDGGEVRVTGRDVAIPAGGRIDVSGQGAGGAAVAYASGKLDFAGAIDATGGTGAGGFVETSGAEVSVSGRVRAGSDAGAPGMWLIDPTDISIGAGEDVEPAAIEAALLGGSDVLVWTSDTNPFFDPGTDLSAGTDAGDISIVNGLDDLRVGDGLSATLTLRADRDIVFRNASGGIRQVVGAGEGGTLNLSMIAGETTATGTIRIETGPPGPPTVAVGMRDILLDGPGSALSIRTGGDVTLRNVRAASMTIETTDGVVNQTAGTTVAVSGLSTLTAGGDNGVNLSNAGNDFGAVAVDAAGNAVTLADANAATMGATAAALTATAAGDLTLGATSVTTLGATSTGGGILQSAAVSATGVSTLSATTAGEAIALGDPANVFGTVNANAGSAVGDDVTIRDAGALVLGDVVARGLTVTAGGAVTQAAGTDVASAGPASVTATGNVTLTDTDNDFASIAVSAPGQTVSVVDANAMTAGAIAAAFTATSVTGALTLGAVNVTTLNATATAGNLTQNGAGVTVGGLATLVAGGSGDITLATAGNSFATVQATATGDAVAVTSGDAFTIRGAASSFGATAGAGTLTLGAITATTLNATASDGSVVQTADGLTIGGLATLVAGGAGDVTLTEAANDLTAVQATATGNTVTIVDPDAVTVGATAGVLIVTATTGDLTLGATSVATLTATATTGSILQTAAAVAASSVSTLTATTAGEIVDLDGSAANDFGVVILNAGATGADAARLSDSDGFSFGNVSAGSLTATSGGTISQQAGTTLEITGVADLTATGAGDITLGEAGNTFSRLEAEALENTVTIGRDGALVLGDVSAGRLLALAEGPITQAGGSALVLTGPDQSRVTGFVGAAEQAVTLTNAGNSISHISVVGTDVDLFSTGAMRVSESVATGAFQAQSTSDLTLATVRAGPAVGAPAPGDDITAGGRSIVATDFEADVASFTTTDGDLSLERFSVGALNVSLTDVTPGGPGRPDQVDGALEAAGGVALVGLSLKRGEIASGFALPAGVDSLELSSIDLVGAPSSFTVSGLLSIDRYSAPAGTLTLVAEEIRLGQIEVATLVANAGARGVQQLTAIDTGPANADLLRTAVAAPASAAAARTAAASVTLAGDAFDGLVEVSGLATLTAVGAGADVALDVEVAGLNNDFTTVTGSAAGRFAVRDANAVTLGQITANGIGATTVAGDVTQTGAPLTAPGASTFDAGGAGDVVLTSGLNALGNVTANALGDAATVLASGPMTFGGAAGVLTGTTLSGALTLGAISAGALNAQTVSGAVLQTADGVAVTGLATVTANGFGDIVLSSVANDFDALSLIALGNAATATDANGMSVSAAASALTARTVTGALTLGSVGVATLNATASAGDVLQTGASLSVSGTATIETGGGGNVSLASAGNQFGAVQVTAPGGAAVVTDAAALTIGGAAGSLSATALAGDLTLAGLSVGDLTAVTTGGSIGQTAAAVVSTGLATLTAGGAGDIALTFAGNDFASVDATAVGDAVTLRDADGMTVAANAASLSATTDAGALTLGAVSVGVLDATASDGDLAQTADGVSVTGAATLVAGGGGDIVLDSASNAFSTVSATALGDAATVTDGGAMTISAAAASLNATSVAGTLTLGAVGVGALSATALDGSVEQTSDGVTVTGLATLIAGGAADIVLTDADNDFGVVSATATDDFVVLTDANGLTAGGEASVFDVLALSGTLTLGATAAGTLTATAQDGSVLQTADGVTVTGLAEMTAGGAGEVTLASAANDFAEIAVTALGDAATVVDANGMTVGADAGALTATALTGDLTLGAVNVTTLNATATDGDVLQTLDGVSASGLATLVAGGAGDIVLETASNDFGTVAVTAVDDAARIADANALTVSGVAADLRAAALSDDLTLGAVTAGALTAETTDGDILQTADGVAVSGLATLTAGGAGDVTLAQATNDFATVSVTAEDDAATLADADGMTVSATAGALEVEALTGDLTLGAIDVADLAATASAGRIVQTADGVRSTGLATLTASGDVTVTAAANDFDTVSILTPGADAAVADSNGMTAGATALSLVASTASGNLRLAAVTVGTLTATTADGDVTQTADGVAVSGDAAVTAGGAGDIALTEESNDFATVTATALGDAAAVTDANAMTVAAQADALTVRALSGTLAFGAVATGSLTATAEAGDIVQSVDGVTATGVTLLTAGAAGDIALTAAANDFATVYANAFGDTVALADANAIEVGALASTLGVTAAAGSLTLGDVAVETLTATASAGSVLQTSDGVRASGTSTLTAMGAGADVLLSEPLNDFGVVTGSAVDRFEVRDLDEMTFGDLTAETLVAQVGGALTQTPGSAIVIGTATSLTAGSIALNEAGNAFGELTVNATGETSVISAGALELAEIRTEDLIVRAGGDLTQRAGTTVEVSGTTSLTVTGAESDARLTQTGNDLGLLGGSVARNVTLIDRDDLEIAGLRASGDATIRSGGDLIVRGSEIGGVATLTSAGAMTLRRFNMGALSTRSSGGQSLDVVRVRGGEGALLRNGGGAMVLDDVRANAATASIAVTAGAPAGAPGSLSMTGVRAGDGLAASVTGEMTADGVRAVRGDLQLLAERGSATLSGLEAGRNLNVASEGDADVRGATAAEELTLNAIGSATLVSASARDVQVAAGGDAALVDVAAREAYEVEAGGDASLERSVAQAGLAVSAGGAIALIAPDMRAFRFGTEEGTVPAGLLSLTAGRPGAPGDVSVVDAVSALGLIFPQDAFLGDVSIDVTGRQGVEIFGFVGSADRRPGVLTVSGAGDVIFGRSAADGSSLLDDDPDRDYVYATALILSDVTGDVAIVRDDLTDQEFLNEREYYGINFSEAFDYSASPNVASVDLTGQLRDTRLRVAGLQPRGGPLGEDFLFNLCVIGNTGDCSNDPVPVVGLTAPTLAQPDIFEVDVSELADVYGSFGNEELWAAPAAFLEDLSEEPEEEDAE